MSSSDSAMAADAGRRVTTPGRAADWLVDQVEAQADRWTLWTPVALGCGCALHFGLLREPQAWVGWAL